MNDVHVAAVNAAGHLWHTIRFATQTWQPFGDVEGQTGEMGELQAVAMTAVGGDVHVAAVNAAGHLWHTIRFANQTWQPFGDVEGQTGEMGELQAVAMTAVGGDVHVAAVNAAGHLWHTIRFATQTWQPFGDVEGQTGEMGELQAVAMTAAGSAVSLRERADVWTLSAQDPWHPTILWYARAIVVLQTRAPAEPTSWLHLANAHGTFMPVAQWPPGARWNECEHGTWWFLPWHRMYLHHFESIVREAVVALGGPAEWALPYWNYSDPARPDCRRLPPAFHQATMPDGSPNPLLVQERDPGMNGGAQLSTGAVAVSAALAPTAFAGPLGSGFGGGQSAGRNHNGPARGPLENSPHGSVHSIVGGATGWMGSFEMAGRDPIFWLHHANVDRLWEVWLRQPGRVNPAANGWPTQQFPFGSGTHTTTLRNSEIVDTTATPLRYFYTDPGEPANADADMAAADEGAVNAGAEVPPELIGASDAPVRLGTAPTESVVALQAPTGPFAADAEAAGDVPPPGARVLLRLENITGSQRGAPVHDVYLNMDPGSDEAAHFVGSVSMFGVIEASASDDRHNGSGIDATFDITDLAAELAGREKWDPAAARVTLVPEAYPSGELPAGDVSVGRIAIYLA